MVVMVRNMMFSCCSKSMPVYVIFLNCAIIFAKEVCLCCCIFLKVFSVC